jgi:dTDP-4-amino-4,6-dideoxygalactose transaminase
VIAKDPTRLRIKLAKRGIDSAQTSLVLLSELSDYNLYSTNQNLGARTIFQNGVYIPLYHQLKEREIKRVIKLMSQIKGDEFRTSEWI